MSTLLIPLVVSPRRSGKSCQASTSWTIVTSSANLLNLQITSRKCPQSNIFWNRTKKKTQSSCSVSGERMVYVLSLQTWISSHLALEKYKSVPAMNIILLWLGLWRFAGSPLFSTALGFQCCLKYELLSVTSFALHISQGWHLVFSARTALPSPALSP